MKPDEEHLVTACRHGDERACKQLYDTYASKMLGVCLRYVGDRDEAQDILSDGFIKIFTNLDKLQDVQSLGAWIHRVMVNTAINYLRSQRDFKSLDDPTLVEPSGDMHYDSYDAEQLMKAIQALPPLYRTVFNLYEVEGYDHEEIASKLGLQGGYVRLILTRSKRRLQKTLGGSNNYL